MTHSTGCAVCDAGLHAGADELAAAELAAEGMRRRAFLGAAAGAAVAFGVRPGAAAAKDKPGGGHHGGGRTLVLEPSWVLTFENNDLQLRRDHSVVVQDGRIAAITPGRVRGRETRLELPGQLLLPGLISSHTHVALGSPTRGLIESGRAFTIPGVRTMDLDDEDLDALTAYNLAEILRGGCTTQVEQSLDLRQAKSYVRVARRWGVRGYPAPMLPNFARVVTIRARTSDQVLFDSVPEQLAEIEAGLRWGRTVNGAEGGRIRPQMAPQGPETATPETLDAIYRAAKELGNGIHTHLATGAPESATVKRLWGKAPVKWIEDSRLLRRAADRCPHERLGRPGRPAVPGRQGQVHLLALPVGRRGRRGQRRPAVHRGAGGRDQHQRRPRLALQRPDREREARGALRPPAVLADQRHQPRAGAPPDRLGHDQGGHREPGQRARTTDLGRIAVGAKADLTSIDVTGFLSGVGAVPPEPLNNLLYANGLHVRTVMTEGLVQVHEGRLVIDDDRRVMERGGRVVQKIWARLQAEGWFTPTPR